MRLQASISSAAPDTSSWRPSWSRGRARLRSTRCDASTNAGPPRSTRSPKLSVVFGRPDQLPAVLPGPVVLHLQDDVERRHSFKSTGHGKGSCVDGPEADRLDELKSLLLGRFVVAGNKSVEPFAVDLRVGHLRSQDVIERLHHVRFRSLLLDVLRHGRTVEGLAWVLHVDAVGDVDDHLAVELRREPTDHLID